MLCLLICTTKMTCVSLLRNKCFFSMIKYPPKKNPNISSSNNPIQVCPDEDGTQASGGASMFPLRSSLAAERKHYFQAIVKQGTLIEQQINQSNRNSESKRKERTRTWHFC